MFILLGENFKGAMTNHDWWPETWLIDWNFFKMKIDWNCYISFVMKSKYFMENLYKIILEVTPYVITHEKSSKYFDQGEFEVNYEL